VDNRAYYRLVAGDERRYYDTTGTGNSLNVRHHESLRLIMDSLRYWVTEMHVDGFRFDLASALAREFHEVDRLSAFFDLVNQDPVVSQVKLIAEPWDVGEGGYQVGGFPPAVDGVERQVPGHDARLLAGRAGHPGRVRAALHRLVRPLRS
jgi:isoamylase